MMRTTILAILLTALPAFAADVPSPSTVPATRPALAPATDTKVKATLELGTDKQRNKVVRLVVKNTGSDVVSFVDIDEGAARAGEYWDIQVKRSDEKLLEPSNEFAVSRPPKLITLKPGETYTRDFHIGAYVRHPSPPASEGEQGTVVIRYRVLEKAFVDRLRTPPHITFTSEPLQITLRDFFD